MRQERIAIVLYGPPGGGKGTQANLSAATFGVVHIDTGHLLESVVHDPRRQKEATVRRERKLFDKGILMTPSFVTNEVMREVKLLARSGSGIVLSGSPRTMYEAERVVPLLEKLYGKKQVLFFRLDVDPVHSMERNSKRLLCSVCKSPLLTKYYPSKNPKHCPVCGGPFYRRSLDKPEVIKVRLVEYKNRTEPIFDYLKKRGYKINTVDGRPEPYKVFEQIKRRVARAGK